MDANKYEYRITTPFGEATHYKIEDVLDFVRLGIRQFQEITIIRQKMGAVVKDSLTTELTWHKVSEELPKMAHFTNDGDFSDLCVCINEAGEHKILVLCENSDYTYWAYGYDGEGLYDEEMDGGEITHWMPIPEIKEDL